ncbi:branched-chain amino acid ABC transporter permease [Neobacillus niacini]|uniref:branched-chain amino acid ABC transporter permease n=1 Tax=Neobacillus niacini TaxID=86668 RepID=UPI0030004CF8
MNQLLMNKKTWLFFLLVFMLIYPLIAGQSGYMISIAVMICIYAISAMSLDLLIGYGGQISIGHAGFLSVGGYSVAILASKLGLPFFMILPLSGVITAIISLIIGLPAVRLSGHFLAVITLGFGLSIPQIALNWDGLTGGYSGLSVMRPNWAASDQQFYYVIIVMTVLITWLIHNILKSRMGRAFVAIRESEVAAQATGINVPFYKTIMFVITAFFTGLAGGLYGYWIGFISPYDFNIATSFLLLGMIVIGGLASIRGAIIGAVIFTILPELTSSFIGLTNIILGFAIVIIILFRPHGIISLLDLFNIKRFNERDVIKNEFIISEQKQGGRQRNAKI